jgi:Cu2+-containing amine oxidase
VVDLGARKVERWQAIPNVQSGLVGEELQGAERITKADPGWQEAVRNRGYTEFENLFCASMSAGYFADPTEAGRRLVKVVCFDRAGNRINWWGRPIEGLYAVVDLDEKRMVGWPIPVKFQSAAKRTSSVTRSGLRPLRPQPSTASQLMAVKCAGTSGRSIFAWDIALD